MKEAHCLVCGRRLKRRRYRKAGMGPVCARRMSEGYAGIQLKAFEPTPVILEQRIEAPVLR